MQDSVTHGDGEDSGQESNWTRLERPGEALEKAVQIHNGRLWPEPQKIKQQRLLWARKITSACRRALVPRGWSALGSERSPEQWLDDDEHELRGQALGFESRFLDFFES